MAEAREGNGAPGAQTPEALPPEALQRAMREVVGSCIYGVDVSAEAVERAKDRLRLVAGVPGMTPLFLDGRVRQGNALIGASPELIENGIPDEAFAAVGGDDRRHARSLRRSPLARDLDDRGEDPFAWDSERRASLRAELDAFFFRVYGIDDRDDVEYITGTLQAGADGLERDESRSDDGRRARKLVLAAYDRMSEADAAGAGYETRIFPPPGHGPRHRPF